MRNERWLARRATRGDRDAFAKIFRHLQQDLYRYCAAILGDPQDAEDALQNTMVKALAALPGERREIELKPWLYRIAHNESVELRRRARPVAPLADDVPVVDLGPEQRVATRQRLRDLLADVGALPERQRGALVMRELAGLDFDQIGAALDTSSGAARQVLYEARRGLQKMSEGREMKCDLVTAALSAEDGRRLRRRDIQAHLRGCAECRRFSESIATRRETFAAISPLPALAAAALLKGVLSGASAGGASASGASASGTAATTVAGAGVKAVSTATLLKSAAGVAAIVAVGAVAAEHGHLLHGAASSPGPHHVAGSQDRPAGAVAGSAAADIGVPITQSRDGTDDKLTAGHRRGGSRRSAGRKAAPVAVPSPAGTREMATTRVGHGAGSAAPGHGTHSTSAEKTRPAHPEHPVHPEHPEHPTDPEHPSRSGQSTGRSAHPESASAGSGQAPTHPAHPEHPVTPAPESQPATAATPSAGSGGEPAEGAATGATPPGQERQTGGSS